MFECHITIEPIFDDNLLNNIKRIAAEERFKVADLLMQKRKEDTPERSKFDTFMTGHDITLYVLQHRMTDLVRALTQIGIKVYRYKIEHIILDSRDHLNPDCLKLLEGNRSVKIS